MTKLVVAQLLPELDAGGVERGTIELAAALVARGHEAIVVAAPGRMVETLERTGAEHIAWPVGHKNPRSLVYIGKLRRLFEQRHVDIVHARSRLPAWLGLLALRGMPAARRPHWVTTVHGPYTVNRYSAVMVGGEQVIAISEFIRDYILSSYADVAPDRITVIPRGVDRDVYPYGYKPGPGWLAQWRSARPELDGKRILTLPARLTRWKGQEDFIGLIVELRMRGHDVHGLIAGAPHPRKQRFEQELRERVAQFGLSARISFLGHRTDLREVLGVSDLACSLTREPEAFGRTTIEALSLGVPVLGYDHGGTGEILRRVFPAGLAPPADIARAATVAEELLTGTASVPRVHPYTLERMLDDTLALYARLSARSGDRSG